MTVRYILKNHNDTTIFSNFSREDIQKTHNIQSPSIQIDAGKSRAGTLTKAGLGKIIAITSDPDLVASSKSFKQIIDCILNSISYINSSIEEQKDFHQKNMNRLMHNLTTLNGHNIQEIYAIIPQEELSNRNSGHIEYIKSTINNYANDTAIALLKIAKNNAAIRTEISVFKNLINQNPKLDRKQHGVHKVVMNILYLFFPDFTDKNIVVRLSPSTISAFFDYSSLHVALYHLLDNAAKYSSPNQEIISKIETLGNFVRISFSMLSLKITDKEMDLIFNEGFSGELPKQLKKSGGGIGMGLIKNIIKLNDGDFSFERKIGTDVNILGIPHQNNIFKIDLPSIGSNKTNYRSLA